MTEIQRAAARRRDELEMFRDWLHSHPHRSDPEVRPAAIDWLNSSIAELDRPGEKEKYPRWNAGTMMGFIKLTSLMIARFLKKRKGSELAG